MFWHPIPSKIAYLALCLAIVALFTPGFFFVGMDQHPQQQMVALKGFLSGMIISCISLTLSIIALSYHRNRDDKEGAKFSKIVIIVSIVILILHSGLFTLFLTT